MPRQQTGVVAIYPGSFDPITNGHLDLVRRGRNRAGPGPRRGDAATYGQATGFETMLGWLFLRNPGRLAELLDHLEETASTLCPSAHESPP